MSSPSLPSDTASITASSAPLGARKVSPMVLEIIEGAIESTMRQMDAQVDRTARSTVMREANEHVPAIYDARGRSVASVSFTANVDPILQKWPEEQICSGDVFVWNHPYQSCGGIGHVPDICLTVPVFDEQGVVAYVQEMGHVQDIGGIVVGSMSQTATEVFQEGVLIPPMKLFAGGVLNEEVYSLILANTRFPDLLRGDMDAMIGGCRLGAQRLQALCAEHSGKTVRAAFDELLARCARTLREEVFSRIPEGCFRFEDFVEYVDVSPAEPRQFIRIALTLERRGDRLHFDFTGTDSQVAGSINFPADERFYARALLTTFQTILPESLVLNDGVLEVVDVELPAGTVLSPRFPAACSYRHYPLIRTFGVALGALASALDGQVPQGADNMSGVSFTGYLPDSGERWYLTMPLGGGSSGRPFADGSDAVLMTPGRNVPCEYIERYYPLRMVHYGLNIDSGGAGFHQGGLGYRIVLEFQTDCRVSVRSDRYYIAPPGVRGGRAGGTAEFVVNPGAEGERRLPGKLDGAEVRAGDRLLITSPGGGGWGDPLDRDAQLVELDLQRGLISASSAVEDYGLVVGDPTATREHREALRAQRLQPLALFDRGGAFKRLVDEGTLTLRWPDASTGERRDLEPAR